MRKSPSKPQVNVRKHLSSSILLWMRTDQPRQTGMDHWKGPHSKIISATPGLEEYRQILRGALTRFGFGWAGSDRRVVRPSRRLEELVLVLVVLLRRASARSSTRRVALSLERVQGAGDRGASARARRTTASSSSA